MAMIERHMEVDEIDVFISSINMLGEELTAATISQKHFYNIFNAVSDMLFVLNERGVIEHVNQCVSDTIGVQEIESGGIFIDHLITVPFENSFFGVVRKKLSENTEPFEVESILNNSGRDIPIQCTGSFLCDEKHREIGYLIRAKDLSVIKKYENSLKESEEKYRKLFEESSDCIFIVNERGNFVDLNKAGLKLFQQSAEGLKKANCFNFFIDNDDGEHILQTLKDKENIVDFKARLLTNAGTVIDCLISANRTMDKKDRLTGYQGMIRDITHQKETENLIIRAIVDTQEKERIRFAKDIHDSLGQQLSAIKFYLATLVESDEQFEKNELLTRSNEALISILADIRNICFNLMPKTLEDFGLIKAVKELCFKNEFSGSLIFKINADKDFPLLNKSLEIAIFRIIQEFINNAVKHGKADRIEMWFQHSKNYMEVDLHDNGVGFEVKEMSTFHGMGLKNILSRVHSYFGEIKIISTPDKGTRFKISIPAMHAKSQPVF